MGIKISNAGRRSLGSVRICRRVSVLIVLLCACWVFFSKEQPVHVVFACDTQQPQQVKLLLAAINSIHVHFNPSRKLVVHVFLGKDEENTVQQAVVCATGSTGWLHTHPLDPDVIQLPIAVHAAGRDERRLRNKFNFVRFFLPELLPHVHKVIYLDCDVIVKHDLSLLFDEQLVRESSTTVLAACNRERKPLHRYINFNDSNVSASGIDPETGAFNAGVLVIRLDNWQKENVTSRIRHWMDLNSRHEIYTHGSQPPLQLSIGNSYQRIDPTWNVDGAGFRKLSHEKLSHAKIIHWTGGKKGDDPEAWHHDIWKSYDKSKCIPPDKSFNASNSFV